MAKTIPHFPPNVTSLRDPIVIAWLQQIVDALEEIDQGGTNDITLLAWWSL